MRIAAAMLLLATSAISARATSTEQPTLKTSTAPQPTDPRFLVLAFLLGQ